MESEDSPSGAMPERGVWSKDEHDRFLEAVALFPNGPWKIIAERVGTRSVRQVQTHAQKYQEKVERRQRGLQKNRQKVARTEHRVEEASYDFVHRPRAANGRKRGSTNKNSTGKEFLAAQKPTRSVAFSMSPPDDLLLEAAELFESPIPSPAAETVALLPSPLPFRPELPSVTIERMEQLSFEDTKLTEEAPEDVAPPHDVPTLNESLDYFLKMLSVWGSGPLGNSGHFRR